MKARQFFDLVTQMRSAQKRYFRTRTPAALNESKALEKQVDEEIERVTNILKNQAPTEGDLFSQGNI